MKSHPAVQAYRKAKLSTLKDIRKRIQLARLIRYASNPRAILSPSERLLVAFQGSK